MRDYENYAKLRDLKGLKDSDVAKKAKIPPSTFTDWKNKKSSPKMEKLQKIADALEVDYFELTGPVGKYSAYNPNRPIVKPPQEHDKNIAELLHLFSMLTPEQKNHVLQTVHFLVEQNNNS